MNSTENKDSLAVRANGFQGEGDYLGHDTYQNGLLNRDNSRIYMAGWSENWGASQGSTGYFTDQATINSCMDGNKLDTNKLDDALQTKLSDYSTKETTGVFQAHSHVSAYDIDYNRLDALKNEKPELYERLTNPDGMSPNNPDIKVAYGNAEANTQHGTGGGNQYYIDPQTFRDAEKEGVFKYNEKASFGLDSKENPIQRQDISKEKYNNDYADKLAEARNNEKQRSNDLAAEREKTGQTKEQQINSQTVKNSPEKPFIAKPDPAYNYSQTENSGKISSSSKTGGISSESVAATTGGGSQAPPKHDNNSDLSDSNTINKTTQNVPNAEQFATQKQDVSNSQAENGEKGVEQAKRNQNGQNGGSEQTNTNNSAFPEVKKENLDTKPEQTGKGFEAVSKDNLDSIDKINAQRKEAEAQAAGTGKGMEPAGKDGFNM